MNAISQPVSLDDAVLPIQSGMHVFVHGMGATPKRLLEAMVRRAPELRDVQIYHLHTEGPAPHADPSVRDSFFTHNLFIGGNLRQSVAEGRADYIPVFLSEIPALFRRRVIPLDVALISVSPPDRHGFCSLGVSVDVALAAIQSAKIVIAQVNRNMPRTHGDGNIHMSQIHHWVEVDDPLESSPPAPISDVERKIGQLIAEHIEDGACLQMGIGAIPNAVLAALTHHRRLGIHTEMFSDGIIELVEKGVITGEEKKVHRHKIVAGFLSGSQKLYEFVDDNPSVELLDISHVNDTSVIRKLSKMTAINSAVEIDITGQVCADSIGEKMFSGVGGQMDFVRGASLSEGGKPIFALPSATGKGVSRIVPTLKNGAGVVTTRAHVHYVATEYGMVNLYGKNLRERASLLISIAHPDHREDLERYASERFNR